VRGDLLVAGSGAEMVEGWVLVFAFETFDRAGLAYEACRDLIFGQELDASVYRIVLNGRTHVVVLGFVPLPEQTMEALQRQLSQGCGSSLPREVLLILAARHAEVRAPGLPGSDYPVRLVHRPHMMIQHQCGRFFLPHFRLPY
jgi:hypothetical protein